MGEKGENLRYLGEGLKYLKNLKILVLNLWDNKNLGNNLKYLWQNFHYLSNLKYLKMDLSGNNLGGKEEDGEGIRLLEEGLK